MAPHSSTLAWKIPWAEEPGRLQSMGLPRVGHDWATSLSLFTFMHWSRKWQPTPVFLPGESRGRGSLVGCRLWGRTESDTTEATQQQQQHWIFFFLIKTHTHTTTFFWLRCIACGILVPWPRIEPMSPALEAQSLNHWTAGEVLGNADFEKFHPSLFKQIEHASVLRETV